MWRVGAGLGLTWITGQGGRTFDNVLERRLVPRLFLELAQSCHLGFFLRAGCGDGGVEQT